VGQIGERTAVLVDPHPLWLEAVEQVFTNNGLTVAGRTGDFERGVALCQQLQPRILVAEPAEGGVTCIREACAGVPGLKAIALASADDPAQVQAAFAAGAAAYVVKTAHADDIGVAVRQVFAPSLFMPGLVPTNGAPIATEPHPALDVLTAREREILRLVAEGHSNSQLARMLWVTEQTVKFHLSNIYRKVDVSNRTEASRWAHVHGLLIEATAPEPVAAS
jgi:NarL family two-component system response regulator LiaR